MSIRSRNVSHAPTGASKTANIFIRHQATEESRPIAVPEMNGSLSHATSFGRWLDAFFANTNGQCQYSLYRMVHMPERVLYRVVCH